MEAKVRNWLKKYVINNAKNRAGAKKCLKESLALIQDEGSWVKGRYNTYHDTEYDDEGNVTKESVAQYCAIGAINEIDGSHEDAAHALLLACIPGQTARKYFAVDTQNEYYSWLDDMAQFRIDVEVYNDRKATKHKNIVKLFKDAIKLCEAK